MTILSNFSHRDKKRILVVSAIAGILLICWVIFSPNGALKYYQLSRKIEAVQTENQQLQEQNKALRAEVTKLLNDPKYIEEVARKKYGFIKGNEIIFDFERPKKGK